MKMKKKQEIKMKFCSLMSQIDCSDLLQYRFSHRAPLQHIWLKSNKRFMCENYIFFLPVNMLTQMTFLLTDETWA